MKTKLLLLFLSLQLVVYCQPPDVQLIEHQYYRSWFSVTQHIPIVVEYELKKSMVRCIDKIARTNKFAKDPGAPEITNLAKDYKYSGYDKGHNMPAADNSCSELGMKECFYFSNMTPQPHYFNAGVWKSLETEERKYALSSNIKIFTGSIGQLKTIGQDSVVVPMYMWKVIYFPERKTNRYDCYLFPNSTAATPPFILYKVARAVFEEDTDLHFYAGEISFQ